MVRVPITLTPEQEAWCIAHAAAVEEGDDLAWAKPYVNEARAAVARGDVVTLDEHKSRNAAAIRT